MQLDYPEAQSPVFQTTYTLKDAQTQAATLGAPEAVFSLRGQPGAPTETV